MSNFKLLKVSLLKHPHFSGVVLESLIIPSLAQHAYAHMLQLLVYNYILTVCYIQLQGKGETVGQLVQ